MIRIIIELIYAVLSLIISIPFLIVPKIYSMQDKAEKKRNFVHKISSLWAKVIVILSGTKVTVKGAENIPKDGAVVFICNHQGIFDIPILMSYLDKPKGFIAKVETKKLPVISWWMSNLKCVFMDRKSLRKSAEAIITGVGYLKEGNSLIIFPEGTRSNGTKMGEFKAGSFKLATKAEVPIVPVTLNNTYKIMRKGKIIIRPAKVSIIVSPPIETKGLVRDKVQELIDNVKTTIESNIISED